MVYLNPFPHTELQTLSDASVADDCWTHCEQFLHFQPFPSYRRILTHLKQTTFENIVTQGEIAQIQYRDFPYFCLEVFKVVCYRFAACGKGLYNTSFIYRYCIVMYVFLLRSFQSRLLQICCMWERVNQYSHIYLFIGVLRHFQQYFSYITGTVHLFILPWVNKPVLG